MGVRLPWAAAAASPIHADAESGAPAVAEYYERWFDEELPHYLNEQKGELQVGRVLSSRLWR